MHVLLSEGREDYNWDTAQQTHRDIQEEILHSRNLELFEDVERLLPPGKLPLCVEQEMPVDPWDPEEGKSRKRLSAVDREEKAAGKKVKKQRGHEIPEDGLTGFKSVADLLRDCGKLPKGKKKKVDVLESEEEEEEVEEEIERPVKGKRKGKSENLPPKSKKKAISTILSESEESETLVDLDDMFADMDKKKDQDVSKKRPVKRARSGSAQPKPPPAKRKSTAKSKKDQEAARRIAEVAEVVEEVERRPISSTIDLFTAEPEPRRPGVASPMLTPPESPSPKKIASHRLLSPESPRTLTDDPFNLVPPGATKLSPGIAAKAGFSQIAPIDMSWDDDLASSPVVPLRPVQVPARSTPLPLPASFHTPIPSLTSSLQASGVRRRIMGISRPKNSPSAVPLQGTMSRDAMPPPPVPLHRSSPANGLMPSSPAPLVRSSPAIPFSVAPPPRRVERRRAGLPPEEAPRRGRRQARPEEDSPMVQRQRHKKARTGLDVAQYVSSQHRQMP